MSNPDRVQPPVDYRMNDRRLESRRLECDALCVLTRDDGRPIRIEVKLS
jgi:hypothetical protein